MIVIYKYSYSNNQGCTCAVLIFTLIHQSGLVRPLTVLGSHSLSYIGLSLYELRKTLCQIELHLFLHTPAHD